MAHKGPPGDPAAHADAAHLHSAMSRVNLKAEDFPEVLRKDCMLFYAPEMEGLARKIAAVSPSVRLSNIRWAKFESEFPNLFVEDALEVRNKHVAFLASFHHPAVIFEQLSIIYALPRLFVASFTLVLPFFPTGTMERMENEGDVATAFTLARILSNIPLSRGGPTSVVIFDIHALQERFYFDDTVLPLFVSGVPLLRHRLRLLPDSDRLAIVYPDEGAWKRFHTMFTDFPEIICTKVREGNKRIVRLKEGDPNGLHVVIVDDLINTGGTIIECQKLLKAHGAKHVSAYATHGVFPQRSWERFKSEDENGDGFSYVWITDSVSTTASVLEGRKPFEVLTLAQVIADTLQI